MLGVRGKKGALILSGDGGMAKSSALLAAAFGLLAAGCADQQVAAPTAPGDPLEAWNRRVFTMNQQFDRAILRPVAQTYVDVVPEPARNGVHNFLDNLDSPATFANDLLQGEVELAAETIGRFGLNSTLGLGGLIDLGSAAGIPYHSSDFGQTLGVWGVGDEPYLVVPLLGPDNPRDLVGFGADYFLQPLGYMGIRDYGYWSMGEGALKIIDTRAGNLATLEEIQRSSVDPYATLRSLYRQYRTNKIHHGRTNPKELPEM